MADLSQGQIVVTARRNTTQESEKITECITLIGKVQESTHYPLTMDYAECALRKIRLLLMQDWLFTISYLWKMIQNYGMTTIIDKICF